MKQLVIHAGIHRTGTTTLQGHLAAHAEALRRDGVHYPVANGATNHQELAWALRRGKIGPAAVAAWVARESRPDCERTLLSAEDFCSLQDLSFLTALRARYDVSAIIYLRRQDEWLSSWYNLSIKLGKAGAFLDTEPEQFLGQLQGFHWLRYGPLLDRWAAAVGADKLHVRVYEPPRSGDPVADFLAVIGASSVPPNQARRNPSLPADQVAFLRALDLSRAARRKALKALAAIPSDQPTMVFPPATRRAILALYGADNAAVARRYLGRADGRLFADETVRDDEPWYRGDVWRDPDRVRRYVRAVVAVLDADAAAEAAPGRPATPPALVKAG